MPYSTADLTVSTPYAVHRYAVSRQRYGTMYEAYYSVDRQFEWDPIVTSTGNEAIPIETRNATDMIWTNPL